MPSQRANSAGPKKTATNVLKNGTHTDSEKGTPGSVRKKMYGDVERRWWGSEKLNKKREREKSVCMCARWCVSVCK